MLELVSWQTLCRIVLNNFRTSLFRLEPLIRSFQRTFLYSRPSIAVDVIGLIVRLGHKRPDRPWGSLLESLMRLEPLWPEHLNLRQMHYT